MGVVYEARHRETGQRVALKTVSLGAPWGVETLRREIRALAQLRHPGIVRIFDEGLDGGRPWYAMELLRGVTLRRELDGSDPSHWDGNEPVAGETAQWDGDTELPTPASATPIRRPGGALGPRLALIRRLCAPLAFLHGEGLVHRDLKPENILIVDGERPVIIDFGLAAQFAAGRLTLGLQQASLGPEGTLDYIAPEVLSGEVVDARADLYALGCILYEIVSGARPFRGTAEEVMRGHLDGAPAPLDELVPELAPELVQLIHRLMQKRPRDRLGYAEDVARILGAAEPEPLAPPARPYLYRPRLAGRESVLAQLLGALGGLAEGRGACVVVAGESGVGKTRLLSELIREALARRFHVLVGECPPHPAPLEALRRPLSSLADRLRLLPEEKVERIVGAHGQVIADFAPELATLPGQSRHRPPPRLPPSEAEERFLRALVEIFTGLAAERAVLLLLDDMHAADELTISFLRRLLAQVAGRPLLVVATHRSDEESVELRRLADDPRVVRMHLGRLGEPAIESMVGDMLALPTPPQLLSRTLAQQSEGNPFFVTEYLRLAVTEGLISRESSGAWRLPERADLPLPGSLRELIGRRLDGLGADARALADAVAVFGREAEAPLLSAMTLLDQDRCERARSELLRRQIFEETQPGRLRFQHAKLAEVAYSSLDEERRRELHRRAAAAIEAHSAVANDPHHQLGVWAAALAVHHQRSGQLLAAARSYRLAAEHALTIWAMADAIQSLESAIAVLDELPETDETLPLKVDARLDLYGPRLQLHSAADDANLRICREAEPLAERLGDPVRLQRLWGNLIGCFYAQAAYEQCLHYCSRVMAMASERGDVERAASIGYLQAMSYLQMGRLVEHDQMVLPLITAIEDSGLELRSFGAPYPPLVCLYGTVGYGASLAGRRQEGERWVRRSLAVAVAARHLYAEALAQVMWSWVLTPFGDATGCLEHAEEARRLAEEHHFPGPLMMSLASRGVARTLLGEAETGIADLERSLALSERLGYWPLRTHAYAGLAEAFFILGERDRARTACESGLAFAKRTGEHKLDAELHRLLAELHLNGDLDLAQTHFEASVAASTRFGTKVFLPRARLGLSRLFCARGENERAEAEVAQAAKEAREMGMEALLQRELEAARLG
jgi:tetratricopeptide (TPR) repeat protein